MSEASRKINEQAVELGRLRAENHALKFALGRIIHVASTGSDGKRKPPTNNAYSISGLGQPLEDAVELLERFAKGLPE